MPPLKTWLIRHGESTANAGLPAVKDGDAPLTEHGIQQSREVAHQITQAPDCLIISPALRARATASFILLRWPNVFTETWPIQELTYLSPLRCQGTTREERRSFIQAYWKKCDPQYVDGEDSESFADFYQRLQNFHARLLALQGAFVVVVGHGQFFHAYSMALKRKLCPSPESMRAYRHSETADPMKNGEILSLAREDLVQADF